MISVDERLWLLSKYLADPAEFSARWLHDYGAKPDKREDGLRLYENLQWLAWLRVAPADRNTSFRLNVVVVDNEPWEKLIASTPNAWESLLGQPITISYVHFAGDARDLLQWEARRIDLEGKPAEGTAPIDWKNVDLILQDVYLGSGTPLGYELAEQYFEIAPQAMVFLLTSMELEPLASTGVTHRADRTISKRRVKGILWEYYSRFKELYGQILWPAWESAAAEGLASGPNLRALFGALRKWHLEPEILFHGHALPEMVEHAHRHTRAVWDLAQATLSPLLRDDESLLSHEERVLLCLGIWLHDVGHVGDENFTSGADIRPMHGSISDRHLVRNPAAVGLDWLMGLCGADCRDGLAESRLKWLNNREGCGRTPGDDGPICPLRSVGLLARYHQQSAPLTPEVLGKILAKGRPITPYCRVRLGHATLEDHTTKAGGGPRSETPEGQGSWIESGDAAQDARAWLQLERSLGWQAHTVRFLGDFRTSVDLLKVELLLRWLDALQLHHSRIGSAVREETLRSYLAVRGRYVEQRRRALERDLDEHGAYDARGLSIRAELENLNYYDDLLKAQEVHYLLHASVGALKVENGAVIYELREEPLRRLGALAEVIRQAAGPCSDDVAARLEAWVGTAFDPQNQDHQVALWRRLVGDEFIWSELQGHPNVNLHDRLKRFIYGHRTYRCRVGKKLWEMPPPPASESARESCEGFHPERRLSAQVLIDCDPGVDDALALILLGARFESVDICATAGNVGIDQTLANAQLAAAFLRDEYAAEVPIAVFRGASASLLGDRPTAASVHGRDGLGDIPLLEVSGPGMAFPARPRATHSRAGDGVTRIREAARRREAEAGTKFVFTGPLTDLALALLQDENPKALIEGLGQVVVMGGAFRSPGNVTPAAEFNCYYDPQALRIVLAFYGEYQRDKGKEDQLYFVGLDVTQRVQLWEEWIATPCTPLGKWAWAVCQKYFSFHSRSERAVAFEGANLHDDLPLQELPLETDERLYDRKRQEVSWKQRLGLGTSQVLPRFSNLHDPLAAWIAGQLAGGGNAASMFTQTRVIAEGVGGGLRGAVSVIDRSSPKLSEAQWQPGTTIHYLDPKKFTVKHYRSFVQALFAACGWRPTSRMPACLRQPSGA